MKPIFGVKSMFAPDEIPTQPPQDRQREYEDWARRAAPLNEKAILNFMAKVASSVPLVSLCQQEDEP